MLQTQPPPEIRFSSYPSPSMFGSQAIRCRCSDDDRANSHTLPVRVDIQKIEAIAEYDHDEDTDNALVERAFAAMQRRAAEHDRGDGGELVEFAGRRLARLQARRQHHAGYA